MIKLEPPRETRIKVKYSKKVSSKIKTRHPTIYLFRHAQTFYNKKHIFTGFKDSKLTPLGRREAKKVSEKLKHKHIDIAYCTHLSRSRDILHEVLKYHPECKKIIQDDRMIERCYGKLQGHTHKAFIRAHGRKLFDIYHRSYNIPPPGGESVKMVENRVLPFVRDLIKKMKREKINVAISTHGNSMRPFRRYFEKLSFKEMMALENPWDDYFEYKL